MIDSTNPRILANNIKKLFARINAITPGTVVTGNPSGSGFNTLLTKIKIGDSKYRLPADVVANPEGEASGTLSKIGIGSAILNVGSLPDYSETEFDTGRKYNNATVYGKIIPVEITATGSATIAHGISNISQILFMSGSIAFSTYWLPLPYVSSSTDNLIGIQADDTNISVFVGTGFGSAVTDFGDGLLYIEYIKTS